MEAVLNWLWQGCVLAVVAAVTLRLLDACRAGVRYAVSWTALAAILVLPFAPALPAAVPAEMREATTASAPLVSLPQQWWTSGVVAAAAWAVWSGIHGVRFVAALGALRRAKRRCRAVPHERQAQLAHWWRRRAQGRRAHLMVSDVVRAAAVLGGRSPVIAVAPALLDRLDADELDRVVIHEWAHVQRRDDLAHFGQLAVRAIAGWHPAVWWLDRRLQIEREVACDELAVAISGSPKAYAASLAKLAELPAQRLNPLPLVGAMSSPLARRVRRILSPRPLPSAVWSRSAAAASAILLGAISIALGAVRGIEISIAPFDAERARKQSDMSMALAQAQDASRSSAETRPELDSKTRAMRRLAPETPRLSPAAATPPALPPQATSARARDDAFEPAAMAPASEPVPVLSANPRREHSLASGWLAHAAAVPRANLGEQPGEVEARSPWESAARAGAAVGYRSKKAGVATAGFFGTVGKRIAGSF